MKEKEDIVCLAHAVNPAEAHSWRLALEDAGIPCQVVGDYLDAGIGDIPGARAELWVPASWERKARLVLAGHGAHLPIGTPRE